MDLSNWIDGVGVEAAEAETGLTWSLGRRVWCLQGKETNKGEDFEVVVKGMRMEEVVKDDAAIAVEVVEARL